MARARYKTWGDYQKQTVREYKRTPTQRKAKQVIISQNRGSVIVNREEIPSLINALLAIGDLK